MGQDDSRETRGEQSDQERLAHALVVCLGREGAIHACQANTWDGVLDFLPPPAEERP